MLDIDTITKSFNGSPAVAGASFRVGLGEMVCLLGPSGCGKSTLLRIIAGLAEADSGRIGIDGRDVTQAQANRRPTAMVFQSHALWNHMTVAQNVAFGLRVKGLPRSEIQRKTAAALALVGLSGFERRLPAHLSGGQAQRVALARCLVVEPKVLLMDEPFSALDAHLRKTLRDELKLLQRRLQLTTIFVTHDQEEAMELADRIVVMNAGRIEQIGRPGDLYLEPQSLQVARFIGSMNHCDSRIERGRLDWFGLSLAAPGLSDGPVSVLNRPEDMACAPVGAACRVARIIDLGALMKVGLMAAGGDALVWLCPRDRVPELGAGLLLAPSRLHLFRDGQRIGTLLPAAAAAQPGTGLVQQGMST